MLIALIGELAEDLSFEGSTGLADVVPLVSADLINVESRAAQLYEALILPVSKSFRV